jgi:hypothetical protein
MTAAWQIMIARDSLARLGRKPTDVVVHDESRISIAIVVVVVIVIVNRYHSAPLDLGDRLVDDDYDNDNDNESLDAAASISRPPAI